jgi:hypothetical protein
MNTGVAEQQKHTAESKVLLLGAAADNDRLGLTK